MHFCIKKKGEGPAIVFIHGFGFNKRIWTPLINTLSKSHCCYALDLPGFGESNFYPYSLHDLVDALLKELPPRFSVCGWSMGGNIALAMALAYPSRIHSLVTLTSNPTHQRLHDWPGVEAIVLNRFNAMLVSDVEKMINELLLFQFSEENFNKQLYRDLKTQIKPIPTQETLLWALDLLRTIQLHNQLHKLIVPSCFVFSELDRVIDKTVKTHIDALQHPQIKTRVLTGAGHLPFYTHENEIIQEIVSLC